MQRKNEDYMEDIIRIASAAIILAASMAYDFFIYRNKNQSEN